MTSDRGKLKGHAQALRVVGRRSDKCSQHLASPAAPADINHRHLRPISSRVLARADKKSNVIIVAVMRKMITTLNAMLRGNAA